jgi:hypothetical protein
MGYTTLAAAISEAEAGDTVKLLSDVVLTTTLSVNKELTLDLDGNKIS